MLRGEYVCFFIDFKSTMMKAKMIKGLLFHIEIKPVSFLRSRSVGTVNKHKYRLKKKRVSIPTVKSKPRVNRILLTVGKNLYFKALGGELLPLLFIRQDYKDKFIFKYLKKVSLLQKCRMTCTDSIPSLGATIDSK